VRVTFDRCIRKRWTQYAADNPDATFPFRLVVTTDGKFFVLQDPTEDVVSLRESERWVPFSEPLHETFAMRRHLKFSAAEESLAALSPTERRIFRLWTDLPEMRLPGAFEDLRYFPGAGFLLFSKEEGLFWIGDSGPTRLSPRRSNWAGTAWNPEKRILFLAEGQDVFAVNGRGSEKPIYHAPTDVTALEYLDGRLWIGTSAGPNPFRSGPPLRVLDLRNRARGVEGFGSRTAQKQEADFWQAIDVGPFGIPNPTQILSFGGRLYVLDSILERILAYDISLAIEGQGRKTAP
jgi:hypothetical protein